REYVIEEPIVSLHPNRPDSGHHQVKANYLFLALKNYAQVIHGSNKDKGGYWVSLRGKVSRPFHIFSSGEMVEKPLKLYCSALRLYSSNSFAACQGQSELFILNLTIAQELFRE
uniref:Uncharacterized protein n=1 Tax=Cucumis melo TaxID=3656 RepID=A0A9I9EJH3_CUCME